MLTFLTGTYFSAKKKYINEKINLLLDKGQRVYLIVPEQSGFDRDRDFLFTYGESKSSLLTVTSFTHLSRDVLEEHGLRSKPEADEAAKNVIMSLAAEDASEFSSIYSKFSGKPQLIKELIAEYSEIRQACLDAEKLDGVSKALPDGTLKSKTRELSIIFSLYETLLGERFSDDGGNIPMMADFLLKNPVFDKAYVFFDDFRGFTAAQAKLISEIAAQCEMCFVSVNAPDSTNALGSEAWEHTVKSCRSVRRYAALKNVKIASEYIPGHNMSAPLAAIESSLFCDEKEIYDKDTDAVVFIDAENKYAECDTAALEIKRLVEEKGLRCRDIAVAERDSGYAEIMAAALKKYGIPVFEDKRVALFDYPLVRAVLSAVKTAVYGFSSEEIFSYIKTGMTGITDEECSALENYIYIWNIDRGGWLKPFSGSVAGYGSEDDEQKRELLSRINGIRERIVAPLLHLRDKLKPESSKNPCRAVYEFTVEINASENFLKYADFLYSSGNESSAVECASAWDALMQSLDALHAALEGRNVTPARFYELLKIILSSGDIGRIPSGTDQIIIGRADRTRFLEPRAMFILGANEGVFPAAAECGGLFSSKERKTLVENNFPLENFSEEIYAEERMIAYSTAVCATDTLFISYSRSSLSGEKKEPSVLVSEIKKSVPHAREINDTRLSPLDKIGSPESAFELCAATFGDNSVFSASLKEYVRGSKYAARFAALEAENSEKKLKMEDREAAEKLFGKNMYITPSKAEAYYKCPFMYFCRYGIKISRLMPARLDARINGLIVHYTLEMLFSKYSTEELKNKSAEEIKKEVDRAVDEYAEKFMGGKSEMNILLLRSIDKTKSAVFEILSRIILEFGTSRFVTRDTELCIGFDGEIKPYFLSLPKGGSIAVGGYVDRVDVMDDEGSAYLRVIDYKTGGKAFKLSDIFDGLNMQMLIYLMCLWDNGGSRYGSVVPAGILYVPARDSGEKLGRHADKNAVLEQRLKNGRMNGMILKDENVIKGMEAAAQGRFINAYIDKNGKMKGTLISLDDFYRLHKKIDSMLIHMGENLHSGCVEALPVIDNGAYKNTCKFCDYADICRRTVGSPSRTPRALSHAPAVEKLKEETENV